MSDSKEDWRRNTLEPAVSRFPQREETFQTDSGITIDTVYTAEDAPQTGASYLESVGFPGEYPVHARRSVQYVPGAPVDHAPVFPATPQPRIPTVASRYLLEQGQTGLSAAFDLPTHPSGMTRTIPLPRERSARSGWPVCTLEDMELLLKDIPLDKVSTSMTINATASVLLCLYIAAARKQGVSEDKLSGTLPERHPEGVHRQGYLRLSAPAFHAAGGRRFQVLCREGSPAGNTISISGYHMREAGATAVQEAGLHLRQRHRLRAGGGGCGAERG